MHDNKGGREVLCRYFFAGNFLSYKRNFVIMENKGRGEPYETKTGNAWGALGNAALCGKWETNSSNDGEFGAAKCA